MFQYLEDLTFVIMENRLTSQKSKLKGTKNFQKILSVHYAPENCIFLIKLRLFNTHAFNVFCVCICGPRSCKADNAVKVWMKMVTLLNDCFNQGASWVTF